MRVTFNRNIKTRSGKCKNGNEVFLSVKKGTICLSRIFTYPTITENNHFAGRKMIAAARLWRDIHVNFKDDLVTYAKCFNQQKLKDNKLPINAFNVFIMALCKKDVIFETLAGPTGIKSVLGENITDWIMGDNLPNVSCNTFKMLIS